jgi:redox-sensing transcriptional repressor
MDKLAEMVSERSIQVAMIAVPAAHAHKVADECIAAGVKSILNYAPITLKAPEGVLVQYIDPVTHLQRMTYYL